MIEIRYANEKKEIILCAVELELFIKTLVFALMVFLKKIV